MSGGWSPPPRHGDCAVLRFPVMKTLRLDVWSDIACPWCYVGKRRLEAALKDFPHRGAVQVVWRTFELDPSAPRVRDTRTSYAQRLSAKYGTPVAQAQGMIQRMTATAAEDGLDFRFDRIRPGNTFDAHRVLHLAHVEGRQDTVKERFLRGYMTEGEAIGEPAVLARLAVEAGLDADAVQGVLTTDQYARDVRADEARAAQLGIQGVPFFVFNGRYGVSGAQPADLLRETLDRAWAELTDTTEAPLAEGAVCGPDGCA